MSVMTCKIDVQGGGRSLKEISNNVVHWCLAKNVITKKELYVNVKICKYTTHQCWGSVERAGFNAFNVTVASNQSLRDFVATLMHEMVHVNQYVTGEWEGDGEAEASSREYDLADAFWKDGNI